MEPKARGIAGAAVLTLVLVAFVVLLVVGNIPRQ